MNKIDLKAILIGGILGLVATMLLGVVYAVLKVAFVGTSGGEYKTLELIPLLFLGAIGLVINGYLIAKFSRRGHIINSVIWGSLMMFTMFLPWAQPAIALPLWYEVISVSIIVPFIYLGAKLYCRKLTTRPT